MTIRTVALIARSLSRKDHPARELAARVTWIAAGALAAAVTISATIATPVPVTPGDLLVTRSVYQGDATTVTVGQTLPGGGKALVNGSYPNVWSNEGPDPSFGVTSPIFVDEITAAGAPVTTYAVPSAQMVTSFSSKSELALNLSTDGTALTFMGYVSPVNALDVSNSNTPNHVDPTNPVTTTSQRAIGQLNLDGTFLVTPVNTYSGNNGRAAILANAVNGTAGLNNYYVVGNAGNGSGTKPLAVINNTGVQLTTPGGSAETTVIGQQKGTCAPPAKNGCEFGFSVTDVGLPADKSGKDDNFRGLTLFGNTLFVTKGSGSNGINTVYQVGANGTLPTVGSVQTTPVTILPGFPQVLASSAGARFPFGIWFANATTLYVADEGDGNAGDAATDALAGLQKWVWNGATWQRAYTLQSGLNLGVQYAVANGPQGQIYPANLNPATDGLRNITGRVNGDGTVTIYAVTSTVSTAVDQGADPNLLVAVTDTLAFVSASDAAGETFTTLKTAGFGEVLRGVALAGPFSVTQSGFVRDRRTQLYAQQVTVQNLTSTPIVGPIVFVLDGLSANATLTNAGGIVMSHPPNGSPYIVVPGTAGGLAPGSTASVVLQFADPTNAAIAYVGRVLNGTITP